MDYKAKYERALNRAKSLYEQHDFEWSDKDIEQIFPELKESDDEKTRKELIERLKWELDGAEQQDAAGCSRQKDIEMFKRGIAWLEKQKLIEWTSEDEANMDAVWKACGQVYGIKYQGILGDWLKTFRPHKNKDNKEYVGGYIDLTIAAIEEYYGDKNPLTSELASWLEKQKPDEWSEEDEKMFLDINSLIHSYRNGSYEHELSSWLESLRFQKQWKPTKEQIETLEFAASYVDCKEDKSVYNSIKLLIDELKRLM